MTTNILIVKNEAFGLSDYRIVESLLYMVDMNMMAAVDLPIFSTKRCVVVHTDNTPMCSDCGDFHCIQLSTGGNYWCQWVYQFAHEYCHHIINGSLSGEWSDLLWFEETVCELSSLYNLHKMIDFCKNNDKVFPNYVASVENYLDDLLTENNCTYNLSDNGGWYSDYSDLLKTKDQENNNEYRRDLYNAIAVLMYPLFLENRNLWKILLHIGDIRSWSSLDELFDHLYSTADETYAESVMKLRAFFN